MNRPIKTKHFLWAGIAVSLGLLLAVVATKSSGSEKIESKDPIPQIVQIPNNSPQTPENFYFIKNSTKKPLVSAEAYYVGDLDTGEIILKKNETTQFPIASVSKLMTATISEELQNQGDEATISKTALATNGENGGFHLNEKIKISDLLYPLLLESSNDAAEAIAENSGRDFFIKKMNEKAKDLGLLNTTFEDPSGLSENNKSTAIDLFTFATDLKKNFPDLLQISSLKSYKNKSHIWFSNSQFLELPGYQGGKRGYTNPARENALSLFTLPLGKVGMRNIGIVVLRSADRYKDVKNILNYLNKYVYYGGTVDADMAWVKSKDKIEDESVISPNSISLLFGGDLMLDRGVRSSVLKNFNGDYSALFNNLDLLKKADIAFANLEGPASDIGSDKHNLYSFRMDPSVIPALKGAGFSVLSVANNHVGDWGRDAYADTLSRLTENEIGYTGGGTNIKEAGKPKIIEKFGFKVGYLGFSDVGPTWMKADDTNAGILLASDPNFDTIVSSAAKQVDLLVVSFHFGVEYQTKHNAQQEALAHKAIDDGAKIIIGSHPHVAEDTEVYKNGYIAYSLGNFIFDQYFSQNTMQGTLLEVTYNKDGTLVVKKDTVLLNHAFQPNKVILGKEEKIKFKTVKTQ